MGDINLRTKINNLDERVSKVEESGGGSSIIVDKALSMTSTNPVQNKVITEALEPNSITNWNYNTTKITYIGSTNVVRIGKMVVVNFNIGIGTALEQNDIVLDNLPAAKYRSFGVLTNAQSKNVVVTIKPNENAVKVDITSDATSFTEGQLVYIAV